jgi:hypothetical protein
VQSVTILLELWRRRALVALVALVAVAVGWIVAYKLSFPPEKRSYKVGVATARILVDTPKSQVVEIAPKGSETLGARANVLANLMVDGEVKEAIAQRAGVRPERLFATAQSADSAEEPVTLAPDALSLKTGVVVNTDSAELPIIKIEAQAPDTAQAVRIADAAVAGLSDYLDSKAAVEEIPEARRLRVSGLGASEAREAVRGPGLIMAFAAAIFVFVSGCTAVVAAAALVRAWRLAVAWEDDELIEPESDGDRLSVFFDRDRDAAPEPDPAPDPDPGPEVDEPAAPAAEPKRTRSKRTAGARS